MKILYLHDLNKETNSALLEVLRDQFELITPAISASEMSNLNSDTIEGLVLDLLGDDFIIMGEGLGAYWASMMAKKYTLFALLINPTLEPSVELGVNFYSTQFINDARGIILVDEPEYERAKHAFVEKTQDYTVKTYQDNDSLKTLIKGSMDDLYFYYRMRASLQCGRNFRPDHYGDKGEFVMAQLTSKILYEEDPANTHCIKNKQRGMYDHVALDVARDHLHSGHSIAFALKKSLVFYFDENIKENTLDELAKKITEQLPDTVSAPHYPLMKNTQDAGLTITKEQASQLEELNKQLTKLEVKLFKDALSYDEKHQKQLDSRHSELNNYEISIKFSAYLQQPSGNSQQESDKEPSAITCELITECSKDKDEYLNRLTRDYNVFSAEHPLSSFRHCWLFHQLYAVANIGFDNLLQIEKVNAELCIDALYNARLNRYRTRVASEWPSSRPCQDHSKQIGTLGGDYRQLPCYPNEEQSERLMFLNKELFNFSNEVHETIFNIEDKLQKQLKDDGADFDYEISASAYFYHIETEEIIARFIEQDFTGVSLNTDFISFFKNHDHIHRMKFMDNIHVSKWLVDLLDKYEVCWYELLNIGDMAVRVKIQKSFSQALIEQQ